MSIAFASHPPGSSPDSVIHAAAIGLLQERPPHVITLEQVAVRAALPSAEVRERYSSWSELLLNVADTWSRQRLVLLRDVGQREGVAALLSKMIAANVAEPAVARVLSSLITVAGTPEHPLADLINDRRVELRAVVTGCLLHDIAAGREPGARDPRQVGEALTALYEAFQQRIARGEALNASSAFSGAVAQLRRHWG